MMPVYALTPFIPVWGESSRLWDQQGKEYIDFAGGIAVNTLGHAHPALRKALGDQTNKFWHTGSGYTNEPVLRLAKKLIDATFAKRIFFCNSGIEANGAVLKLVRKYAHDRFGSQKSGIIASKNAFHGHTLFTAGAGGQPVYSQDLAPLPSGVHHAIYNDLDSTSQLVNDTTCAVIVGPVQGEGGVVPATRAFLQGLRELCDRHNTLLIFDEVRTGVGRTGELHTYMHCDVMSGLLTIVEALGGGFPIGALLATGRYVSMITVGTRDTTYGGSPLAAAVVGKLLEIANISEVLNGVKQRHDRFVERINVVNERSGLFSEIRGFGLLIDCVPNAEFTGRTKPVSQETAAAGIMALIAGANVMRFVPALNASEGEVATGLDRSALTRECIKAGGSS